MHVWKLENTIAETGDFTVLFFCQLAKDHLLTMRSIRKRDKEKNRKKGGKKRHYFFFHDVKKVMAFFSPHTDKSLAKPITASFSHTKAKRSYRNFRFVSGLVFVNSRNKI